jgi:hypothetical protein
LGKGRQPVAIGVIVRVREIKVDSVVEEGRAVLVASITDGVWGFRDGGV